MKRLFYRSNPWWEEEYRFAGIELQRYLAMLKKVRENRDIVFLSSLRRLGKTSILKNFIDHLIRRHGVAPVFIFYISLDLYALEDYSIAQIVEDKKAHKRLEVYIGPKLDEEFFEYLRKKELLEAARKIKESAAEENRLLEGSLGDGL